MTAQTPELVASAVVLAFMVIDFISGFLAAASEEAVDSAAMRQGLYRKFGSIIILFTSGVIDWAETIMPLGFEAPVFYLTAAYIVLMEITSILENVVRLNPGLSEILTIFTNSGQATGRHIETHQ